MLPKIFGTVAAFRAISGQKSIGSCSSLLLEVFMILGGMTAGIGALVFHLTGLRFALVRTI